MSPGLLLPVLCWLWLHLPVLRWLADATFAHRNYRVGVIALGAVAAALLARLRRSGALRAHPLSGDPALAAGPLLLTLGAAAAMVATERFLRFHTLSALLFGLGGYGLLGLYLPAGVWRRGWSSALLLIAVLPLGAHANTYLGLGVRVLTARLVQELLQGLHVASLTSQTILVLENGIAHIDVPCSGVRSLWAGLIFFLGVTWLDRRALGLRWAGCGAALAALLVGANVLRVLVLILVGFVLGRPAVADVLHVPLGVLGFLVACGAALLLLRGLVSRVPEAAAAQPQRPSPRWLAPLLCLGLGGLALLGAKAAPPPDDRHPMPVLPAALAPRRADLTAGERGLFSRLGARAEKWRFDHRGVTGSLLLVSTTSFRAQHPPELCLAAAGLRIDRMTTALAGPGLPVHALSLTTADGKALSAAYWFQSRARATPEVLTRILASLRSGERRWVMASVLFDDPRAIEQPEVRALLRQVHDAIHDSLQGVF